MGAEKKNRCPAVTKRKSNCKKAREKRGGDPPLARDKKLPPRTGSRKEKKKKT